MRVRALALAAALVLLPSSGAVAQAAFSGSHLAAAMELLEVTETPRTLREGMNAYFDTQAEANPGMVVFRPTLNAFFDRFVTWEVVGPRLARVWAAEFSEAELRELAAFHRTALGRKLIARQVQLNAAIMEVMFDIVKEHQAELQQMMTERARELQAQADSSTAP